jgi:hypothetical protein
VKGFVTVFFLLITINLAFGADTVVPMDPTELILDQLPYLGSLFHVAITADIKRTADSFKTFGGPQIFSDVPMVPTLQLSRNCQLWVNPRQILSAFGKVESDAIPYRRNWEIPNVSRREIDLQAQIGLTISF